MRPYSGPYSTVCIVRSVQLEAMASADTLFNSARGPLVRGELVEDNANTATEDPDAADPGEPFLATNDSVEEALQLGCAGGCRRVNVASATEGRGGGHRSFREALQVTTPAPPRRTVSILRYETSFVFLLVTIRKSSIY